MKHCVLTWVVVVMSYTGGNCAQADVFHAGGKTITAMDAKDCILPKGTKFDLAPNPESSASAPSALVFVTESSNKTDTTTSRTSCAIDTKWTIAATELDSSAKYEEWTVGGALIPFKYYTSGDKGVASNATAIGYLGYKWHAPGGGLILGFGAGPTTVGLSSQTSTSNTNSDGATSQSGYSMAFLILGQIGYNSLAQFGIAIGQDRVSKNVGWINNGKTWIGFQIGAKIF